MKFVNKRIKKQHGFTLAELMIAMVVGLLIILGAGQLFITGLQNFHQIERIGNRQGTILFATDMLVSDIRRASLGEGSAEEGEEDGSITSIDWPEEGQSVDWSEENEALWLTFNDYSGESGCRDGERRVERVYSLDEDEINNEGYSLLVSQACNGVWGSGEPLATGFASGGFQVDDSEGSDGVWRLEFCLLLPDGSEPSCEAGESGGDLISIYAVNRSQAVQ